MVHTTNVTATKLKQISQPLGLVDSKSQLGRVGALQVWQVGQTVHFCVGINTQSFNTS